MIILYNMKQKRKSDYAINHVSIEYGKQSFSITAGFSSLKLMLCMDSFAAVILLTKRKTHTYPLSSF